MEGNRLVPVVLLALLLAPALAGSACTGRTAAAIEGARLYAGGAESLIAGHGAQAVRELERAARLVPEASEIRNHLGLAYWSLGRTDEARRAFERAVALDCDNGAARRNLARLESGAPAPRIARGDRGSNAGSRREAGEAARAGDG